MAEWYLDPWQISSIKHFCENGYRFMSFIIPMKISSLDFWLGFEYAFTIVSTIYKICFQPNFIYELQLSFKYLRKCQFVSLSSMNPHF